MPETVNASNKKSHTEKKMTFFEHLDELRKRLFRSAVLILIFAITAFFFKDFIFNKIILSPKSSEFITNKLFCKLGEFVNANLCINTKGFQIINIDLGGQFKAHLVVSLVIAIMLAFPYIIHQIWSFVKPALKKNEIRHVNFILFIVSFLFTFGILFGYFLIVPLSLDFLSTYVVSSEILNNITFSSYLSILTTITLSSGIIFELPILMYFLAKIGLVTTRLMKKYRKHAIIVIFIIAAILTPPDVFSQILVSIPLLLLYEISIFIAKKVELNKLNKAEYEQ
jgi:sec-independent protein translocase protein TatC